ncbi:MAG TPA: hypothetical protein VG033_07410 [Candidatus Acidoferrales bacterium]|jgi:hypothetical protein|nr:hypothetical protein [Candidatus Acidoferrales bacterium]
MNAAASFDLEINRLQRRALTVGAAGLALCVLGALIEHDSTQFFRSYLLAYMFWLSIPLGCMAIVMLHHLTGGAWGFVIRRLLESGTRTLLAMAVLFVPVLFGLSRLYLWAQPAAVAADPILQYKRPYLNPAFFTGRAIFYFAVWMGLAFLLNRWSFEQDRTGEPALTQRLEALSGPGLVLYGLTVTFASVDWVMSLEPHWFSTIYGMLFMVVQGLAAMAFVIVVAQMLAGRPPLSEIATPADFNDLGNLLLTFVMLWAYLAFSQFLIIWSGNLKDEIPWYTSRATGGWAWLAVFLIVFHFAVPFLLLLSRNVKRRLRVLSVVAGALIFLGWVDMYWLMVPAFAPDRPRIHWMDLAAAIGVGGIWIAVFLSELKGRPLVPLHDPRLQEAAEHAD